MPLRDDISQLIAPWRESADKPPFSSSEMAVMAMVLSDQQYLATSAIHSWILRTFSYYNELAIEEFARCRGYTAARAGGPTSAPNEIVEGFPAILRDFDMPVAITSDADYDHWTDGEYGVNLDAARVYLGHLFEPERKDSFRFLDLEPELRNKIYEMVLGFPESVFYISQSAQLEVSRSIRPGGRRILVDVKSPSELLAPFRACKQTHEEAFSVFYQGNTFRFCSIETLWSMQRNMSRKIRQEIQKMHIVMSHSHFQHNYLRSVAAGLDVFSPKHLTFTLNHIIWFTAYNVMRNAHGLPAVSTFDQVVELQEFVELARRAETVEIFETRGSGFEEFVRGQLAIEQ